MKHGGYRLQVHGRAGRVRLFTMNGADRTERYPRIDEQAARIRCRCDRAEVITNEDGRADFDRLHSRCFEHEAIACAFDLLKLEGDDLRRQLLSDRKAKQLLRRSRDGIQYVEHAQGEGDAMYEAAYTLGLKVSKRLTAPHKSGPRER